MKFYPFSYWNIMFAPGFQLRLKHNGPLHFTLSVKTKVDFTMEVDETIPMDEEDLMFNTCLKHSENWRNRFQNLLNLFRDNPFKQEIIFRIGKVVCICDPQQRVIDGSLASLSSVGKYFSIYLAFFFISF